MTGMEFWKNKMAMQWWRAALLLSHPDFQTFRHPCMNLFLSQKYLFFTVTKSEPFKSPKLLMSVIFILFFFFFEVLFLHKVELIQLAKLYSNYCYVYL